MCAGVSKSEKQIPVSTSVPDEPVRQIPVSWCPVRLILPTYVGRLGCFCIPPSRFGF